MNKTLQFSLLGMVLLVGLRMAIGWQLLYEGLWKIDTLDSPRPWSAEGYLKNSQGPARSFFREMTGDPSDFNWLDYETVAARWDTWHEAYVKHYGLDEAQTKKLEEQVNGFKDFRAVLEELPGDWTEEKFNKQVKSVKFVAKSKRLIVDGEQRLTPREKIKLLSLGKGDDEKSKAYQKAVNEVYLRATRNLSAKEKLLAMLEGDATRTGLVLATDGSAEWTTEDDFKSEQEKLDEKKRKEINEVRRGKIELFKAASARYESQLSSAKQDYNYKHLEYNLKHDPNYGVEPLRLQAIGPIKALEKEMKANAAKLLTEKQLTMPPVDLPRTRMDWINFQTIAGLTVLGFLLIGGLFTRTAAVLAAGMLFMFYLAMPPLPGLPPAPGPEHSYIINKNLIEVLALLAIAAFPTGQWFGLDSVISWLRGAENNDAESGDAASGEAGFTAEPARAESTGEATETAGADGGGDCAPEG